MPRKAPPVLDHSVVDGADDRDLLSERARRGLDRAQRGMQGDGAGWGRGRGGPGVRACVGLGLCLRAVAGPPGRG